MLLDVEALEGAVRFALVSLIEHLFVPLMDSVRVHGPGSSCRLL